MALISGNTAMHGVRGRLGEFYYRMRYSFQEVCMMPRRSNKPPTPAQLAQRELMKEGNIYAKRLKTDPEMRNYYKKMAKKKNLTNAYHSALSHYMTCPKLRQVDFNEFTGRAGDRIRFQAFAWKSVAAVFIKIKDAGGTVLQSGPAQPDDYDWWSFAIREPVANWQSATVSFELTDDLDHVKTLDVKIPG